MNDNHLIMIGVAIICGLAAVSSIWPASEWIVPAALGALAVAGWATWAIRRELRIRRRLAMPSPRPAEREARA